MLSKHSYKMDTEEKCLVFDIEKDCRVCLQSFPTMIKIFGEYSYKDMLTEYCKVNIDENDGLPVVVCELCVHDILLVQTFINKCRDTDTKLRLALESKNDVKLINDNFSNDVFVGVISESVKVELTDASDNDFDDRSFSLYNYIQKDNEIKEPLPHKNNKKSPRKERLKSKKSLRPSRCENKAIKKKPKYELKLFPKKNNKHDPEFPRKCFQCPLMLKSKSIMVLHMVRHTKENPFECDHCGKCVRSKGSLKAHIIRFHLEDGVRKYLCKECNKSFYRKTDLTVHLRTHSGETPYPCTFCPRMFTQTSSMRRHIRTHTGQKPFVCVECSKAFCTSSELDIHKIKHKDERIYSCTICGNFYKSKASLKLHMFVHSNPKAHICDHCGTSFNNRGNLGTHIKRVHSEKAGECNLCKKEFSNLEDHMRTHNGETPFQCHVCNKKYSLKQSLRIHIRKHDDPNKYACDYEGCSSSFKRKWMLDLHVGKYHMKQPAYICRYCSRGFFRLSDVRRHTDMSHSDKDYVSTDDLRKSKLY